MSNVVLDSCVVVKAVLPESDSATARRILSDVGAVGGAVIVLDIAHAEVVNAIWTRFHRGLLPESETDEFLRDLEALAFHIEPSRRFLRSAYDIAKKYDRSVYDALFVAAARGLGLRGVTSDLKLHAAVYADYPEIIRLQDW